MAGGGLGDGIAAQVDGLHGALLQEVLQHRVAMLGEDGLGMELHALDGQRLVAHAHDLAIGRPGRDLEFGRASVLLDGERVVAIDREVLRQVGEHAFAGGRDLAGLAVHQLLRAHDPAAERRADGLVPEADTEDGQLAGEVADRLDRNAGLRGRARAGGNHEAIGLARRDAFDGDFVIAKHFHLGAQFTEVLHQVEGEAVVVVDHEEFHCGRSIEHPDAEDAEDAEVAQKTQKKTMKDFIACSPRGGSPSRRERR